MSERFFSISRPGFLLPVVLLGAVAAAVPAAASKLDKDTCSGLAQEFTALTADGLKAEMERGPTWAFANMPSDRLRSARRLLEVEDQLEFRCGGRGLPPRKKPRAPAASPAGPTIDARSVPPAPKPGTGAPAPKVKVTSPASSAAPAAAPGRPAPAPVAPATRNAKDTPTPGKGAGASAGVAPKAPPGGATTSTIPQPPGVPQTGALNAVPQKPAPPAANSRPAPATAIPVVTHPTPQKATSSAVAAANPQQPVAAREAPAAVGGPPVTKLGPLPSAATAAKAAPASTSAGAAAASKKNPRRTPSSAYVSPSEVSPFSLPGLR
ncbi:Meckel syndrome type 1 protein [Hyphomicrobium sp. 1Nfss2.1]|uniref:hypothetical protein n=1 Tax=Hyphomicrobium sp. 1Nfss2.1 TaxID=3413936 RepID=UPI003C7CD9F5